MRRNPTAVRMHLSKFLSISRGEVARIIGDHGISIGEMISDAHGKSVLACGIYSQINCAALFAKRRILQCCNCPIGYQAKI